MTYDPKLVETVARAIYHGIHRSVGSTPRELSHLPADGRRELEYVARAALAAINASGTHWVAPAEIASGNQHINDMWQSMRAYLAEQPDKPT